MSSVSEKPETQKLSDSVVKCYKLCSECYENNRWVSKPEWRRKQE